MGTGRNLGMLVARGLKTVKENKNRKTEYRRDCVNTGALFLNLNLYPGKETFEK